MQMLELFTFRWLRLCFGQSKDNLGERTLRVAEEALELAQAELVADGKNPRKLLHALVDQVCDKPVGEPFQELGGVMVTLGAYAMVKHRSATVLQDPTNAAQPKSLLELAWETELMRIMDPQVIEQIRKKQATKVTNA